MTKKKRNVRNLCVATDEPAGAFGLSAELIKEADLKVGMRVEILVGTRWVMAIARKAPRKIFQSEDQDDR